MVGSRRASGGATWGTSNWWRPRTNRGSCMISVRIERSINLAEKMPGKKRSLIKLWERQTQDFIDLLSRDKIPPKN